MPQRTARRQLSADKAQEARLEQARRFSIEAARLCADSRCRDVRILDVSGLSPVTDFFVLATAASARQMSAVARDVVEISAQFELRPMSGTHRGEPNDRWVAIDLVDAIVHLLNEEARAFYDLDSLWGDAPQVPWTRPESEPAAATQPAPPADD